MPKGVCLFFYELPAHGRCHSSKGPFMTPSDAVLLERISNRDTEAFEVLFDRYHVPVRDHLARMVRQRDTAEDLVQEVFFRVWNRAEQWSGQGAFRAWLFRIATNLALNDLRSKKRRREQPLEMPTVHDDAEEESPAPGWMIDRAALGPDVQLEQSEQRQMLRQLIENLPEDKREVFQMVHDGELPLQKVAQQLAIPEGTVKSRLFHARKQLADAWLKMEG